MASDSIKQWATGHDAAAVSRVAKRIARFAKNTQDPDTSLAAQDLVDMIENAVPDKTPMGETEDEDLVGT